MNLQITWLEFKKFVEDRLLSIQYIEYRGNYLLIAVDGNLSVNCMIPLDPTNADTIDFNSNFKAVGNKSPVSEVVTQFEKEDKILKLFSAEETVVNGTATILLKTPGTPGSGNGRYIDAGIAWFNEQHNGDRVYKIEVVDIDNLLGYGAGVVLKTYHDNESLSDDNYGWRIPKLNGLVQVNAIGGYGFIPSGIYLRIIGKKGESQQTGTFYINIKWGGTET